MLGESRITDLQVFDVRFPTSLEHDGSDATHPDPDYSACYVIIKTDSKFEGCGLAFTIGRGNELLKHAVDSLRFLVIDKEIRNIQNNFLPWLQSMTNDSQLRWVGPEKGVIHMATAAIVNAFWDLWAKIENKPVWKLLVDMSPEDLVSLIDFRYIDDCITKSEAIDLLKANVHLKTQREKDILLTGYPAYTTQVGWLGYPDEKIRSLAKSFLAKGFTSFKIKVGSDINDDIRRLKVIREVVGDDCHVMVDANQKWGVNEAIDWMKKLAQFKLTWIEEPTSPDDVMGHKKISDSLREYGIGVATGEMCQNRVMFKQFLMSGAMQFCQIDSARMAGLNEVLAVYLMAAKLGVPVCPHAGGVGLCEMVFDYVAITGTTTGRIVEYVDHLHEHFINPPRLGSNNYFPPLAPGYSTEMKEDSVKAYEYPNGEQWRELFQSGRYSDPSLKHKRLV